MDEAEESIAVGRSNAKDREFDRVIGHIEDIMIDGQLQEMQECFMAKHCHHFEDVEENKLIYTDLFTEYVSTVERFLEAELLRRIPGFSMPAFMRLLQAKKHEVCDELMELLLSFSDFLVFKQLALDYKKSKECGDTTDESWLTITGCANKQ